MRDSHAYKFGSINPHSSGDIHVRHGNHGMTRGCSQIG
jgi:hypothetical protein